MQMLEDEDGHSGRFVSADRQIQDALVCCGETHHKTQKVGSQNLAFSWKIWVIKPGVPSTSFSRASLYHSLVLQILLWLSALECKREW